MSTTRSLFILAAVPFTLFILLFLLVGQGGGRFMFTFAFCGGVNIYGSIAALRGQLPLSALILVGLILNAIGAFVWLPSFRFSDGTFIGLVGLGLTLAWLFAVIDEYRNERH